MKKIYTSPDLMLLGSLAAFLENRGFKVLVHGADRLSTAGGIAPIECWPELLLLEEDQEEEVLQAIAEFRGSRPSAGGRWRCEVCGEELEGQFTDCWRCHGVLQGRGESASRRTLRGTFFTLLLVSIALESFSPDLFEIVSMRSDGLVAAGTMLLWLCVWSGLLFTKRYARVLFALLWAARVSWYVVMVSSASYSGIGAALVVLNALAAGALLAVVFLSPLSEEFEPFKGNSRA